MSKCARTGATCGSECRVTRRKSGDMTAIELFAAGIRGCEPGLRRRMDDGKANPDLGLQCVVSRCFPVAYA
jgi:hypothetical protein